MHKHERKKTVAALFQGYILFLYLRHSKTLEAFQTYNISKSSCVCEMLGVGIYFISISLNA